MNIPRFQLLTAVSLILAGAALAPPTSLAKTQAEAEAEAAREFQRIKATAPLTTDQEIIDYIACVANKVVDVLDPEDASMHWEMAILETDELNAFVMAAAIEMPKRQRINVVSPGVIEEAMDAYGSFFRGFEPVPAGRAALAYAKSVEGCQTGRVYRVA